MDIKYQINPPNSPGVYLMKNAAGNILYVGKAKSLKSRVRSYFHKAANLSYRIKRMISQVTHVDFIVTGSEVEALILESNLIKRHKPRFNVLLRDDKHYPYIKLTTNEEFPRLLVVRRVLKDGATYFGPFPSGNSVKETLKLIYRIFRLRKSRDPLDGSKKRRPCLNYQIGLCLAPCAGYITKNRYDLVVKEVLLFLKGRNSDLIKELKNKMENASIELRFEEAAAIRDQIIPIEKFMEKQSVLSVGLEERDIIAFGREKKLAVIKLLFIRRGKVIGDKSVFFRNSADIEDKEIVSAFLTQYYSGDVLIPDEIIIEITVDEMVGITDWLCEKKGVKVSLVVPQRGFKMKLIDIARENARSSLRIEIESLAKTTNSLVDLKERLGLKKIPETIEGFDISTISGGRTAVGAMVVFELGKSTKKRYRRYRIKDVEGIDDFAMMREVLTRRFRAIVDSEIPLPDLILVDGGKGHVSVVKSVLTSLDINNVDLAGISKGQDRNNPDTDELYLAGVQKAISLPQDSPGKMLLQRVRDEAHRFAISYHRNIRNREGLVSELDSITGIGPKRKKELLKSFGSLQGVRDENPEKIAKVLKISEKRAKNIIRELDKASISH